MMWLCIGMKWFGAQAYIGYARAIAKCAAH